MFTISGHHWKQLLVSTTLVLVPSLSYSQPVVEPALVEYSPQSSTLAAFELTTERFTSDPKKLHQQRFAYKAAKQAIGKRHFHTAKAQLAALEGYPLKPYIEYDLIAAKIAHYPKQDILAFQDAYPDSLLADKLTANALYFLAEQRNWPEFLSLYTPGFSSTQMQCRNLLARYHTGDKSALAEGVALWAVGKSQPNTCDPLFALLQDHKYLTDTVRWQRFVLAMENRQTSLARYISRAMSPTMQKQADLFFAVDSNPKLVTQHERFSPPSLTNQHIIAHGIQKLAKIAPQLAWQHWEKYEAEQLFEVSLAKNTKQTIIKQLTNKGFLEEAQTLLSYSHSIRDDRLTQALIRENLAQQNWQGVLSGIQLLDAEEQSSDRWQYWRARAQQALNLAPDEAEQILQNLALNRSWYGFLAADHLDKNYQLVDASHSADKQLMLSLEQTPALARAKELWIIGEHNQARVEWHYALKALSTAELVAAGELARDWGWYNSGITAMIRGNLWDHLSLRFPLAYKDTIEQAAINTQLDEALIYAIARQESAFAEDVVSHAGARGLMQLMPATAKEQARHSGVKNHQTRDLFKPDHNIQLGSAYFSGLLEEFDGNRILATAAYNAGKHRVKRWLKVPQEPLTADIWVEIIPFSETRQYVQNVLTYSVIYRYRLAEAKTQSAVTTRLLTEHEANIAL